jgi:hypothetical protein
MTRLSAAGRCCNRRPRIAVGACVAREYQPGWAGSSAILGYRRKRGTEIVGSGSGPERVRTVLSVTALPAFPDTHREPPLDDQAPEKTRKERESPEMMPRPGLCLDRFARKGSIIWAFLASHCPWRKSLRPRCRTALIRTGSGCSDRIMCIAKGLASMRDTLSKRREVKPWWSQVGVRHVHRWPMMLSPHCAIQNVSGR